MFLFLLFPDTLFFLSILLRDRANAFVLYSGIKITLRFNLFFFLRRALLRTGAFVETYFLALLHYISFIARSYNF